MSWFSRLSSLGEALVGIGRTGVTTNDYRALASWLSLPAHRDRHPVAQVAIVGRQGCSRDDGQRLRDELLAAREVLTQVGVYVPRQQWNAFADRLGEAPLDLTNLDDVLRLAVLGQLERGHTKLALLLSEARENGNDGRTIFLEWMVSGTVNGLEMRLSTRPLAAREALARLRQFIREPMSPRPDPVASASPANRALDAIVAKLGAGNGLSVREDHERVELVAQPQETNRDFI